MDVLLARVAEVMSECSRFWGCDVLDTVERVIFNLVEINRELCGYMQNSDTLLGNRDLRSLQQCLSQLLVHWKTKLSIEACGGRPKKTINIELVN